MMEVGATTPLGISVAQVRAVIDERYTEAALLPPREWALTAQAPVGPGSFRFPTASLVLEACVEQDVGSDPPTHVTMFWVFDRNDVLIGMASRRRRDSADAVSNTAEIKGR